MANARETLFAVIVRHRLYCDRWAMHGKRIQYLRGRFQGIFRLNTSDAIPHQRLAFTTRSLSML